MLTIVAKVLAAVSLLLLLFAARPQETGGIRLYLLERPVGREEYRVTQEGTSLVLDSELDLTDRGGRIQLTSSLRTARDFTVATFHASGRTYRFVNVDVDVSVSGGKVTVRNGTTTAVVSAPGTLFAGRTYAPVSAQAWLVRYWEGHGRPDRIDVVPGAPTLPVRVRLRGSDVVWVNGRSVRLKRYSIDGLVWGRETIWLDPDERFAALTTRIHILPLEAVRDDLAPMLARLQDISNRDRMEDLGDLSRTVRPIAPESFALIGARVIDGTGAAPLDDAVVVVRGDRITAVGPRKTTIVPTGVRTIAASGKVIIPGMWDMHAHASQIEWAPAYLAAGVTTARDMGGERAFLIAFRDAVASRRGIGPRLLLAGLVDGGGPYGFGTTIATTPEEGRAIVDAYQAAHFDEMKLYSQLSRDVVRAIAARAHELGMLVTGHVPNAMSVTSVVNEGMDQVAHLSVRAEPGSPEFARTVDVLKQHRAAIDPTQAWNELLGRARGVSLSAFEPGIAAAPPALRLNYESVTNETDAATAAARLQRGLAMVKALHDAGVTIVAGTDGAVPGVSLLREIELYVQAGFSPIDAIRAATIVPATVMRMNQDVGTIEPGKRADLVVLDKDPLARISNIRATRWVVANGRIYDALALRRAALN